MTTGAMDLHRAIATLWEASGLNTFFTALWSSGDSTKFTVLNEQQAAPGQPFPYVVYEIGEGRTVSRMSKSTTSKWEIRDLPATFRIHTRMLDGDNRSQKEIASDLASEVLKIFGGHPTVAPSNLTLSNGNFLISVFKGDYGLRNGDDEYQWNIAYTFRLDIPVMT